MLHTILSNPELVVTTLMLIFWHLMTVLVLTELFWSVCSWVSTPGPTYTRQQYDGLSEDNKAKWKSTHYLVE